jgi:hypothetical protein
MADFDSDLGKTIKIVQDEVIPLHSLSSRATGTSALCNTCATSQLKFSISLNSIHLLTQNLS